MKFVTYTNINGETPRFGFKRGEKIIDVIRSGIWVNENKKDSQLLRSECATLEHQSTECLNDILKEILEDINNLEKDFRKLQQSDLNETAFLKQQAVQLQQEKMRL